MKLPVPKATVQRLPLYLQLLEEWDGGPRLSSDQLAALAGLNAAKVRKDLSYLGSHGVRGVGYEVEHLRFELRRALGLTRDWKLAIVGIGNLGSALANYTGFQGDGFAIVGLFDDDPAKEGQRIHGCPVEPISALPGAVSERGIDIGVLTVPADSAQEVAEMLASSGVRSILNFAPVVVHLPDEVEVRRVDLSTELQVLGYHLHGLTTQL